MNINTKFKNNVELAIAKKVISGLINSNPKMKRNKHYINLINFMDSKNERAINKIVKKSFEVPTEIPYALVENKLPMHLRKCKKLNNVWSDRGCFYSNKEMASRYGLSYAMIMYRIKAGWTSARIFCVENHRTDHYIAENLKIMGLV